jgi:transcriptional regulator with XRE-family HTH domain
VQKHSETLKALGSRIRDARNALQWTQEDFAHEAGLDRSYVGGIERGERNISFSILCRIAEALKTDLGKLLDGFPSAFEKREAREESRRGT